MAIRYQPDKLLKKMAPQKTIEKLVTSKLKLSRAAVTMLARSSVVSKETITEIALKVLQTYRKKFGDERKKGLSVALAKEEALNGKALMVQRVKSTVVFEVAKGIRHSYRGERYIWLPSSANEPDPLHQLNYGKRFTVGLGEMPGDRFGCQCGMQILVDDEELEL